ncbi:putative transcription regulator mTERF family [Helianthus annuus]|uniref:Transcription regulator mTERF family n=1 Tax=Helianthus annuus TaxID=4232 RepID=A0A9K3NSB4_HELAN|nr:transcription termination factor MTEF1, chloroplastic-like [Helianthus annuus]KAF5810741.1 putative transcription regulator mTERF family [Helianthus annuus]KAJ0581506.1 putative transcription regulator mTERF family [Helianthus annuus]KAJ0589483.1 putative transcription regulator mTERF family [Helianthus annuus]KAJ0597470.1 putative transcription regulator mTERF family [Helianthus annuus]KAJ0758115.1 putative transcription regulator mTERF family [Helianthus annuus]
MVAAAAAAVIAFHSYSPQEQQQANAQQSTDTPQLSKKPKTILHKNPLYTPVHSKLSLQFKEKILCLEVMGVDSGKALSLNPLIHSTTLNSIHNIITFLQSKGILQKDLPRIIGMCPKILTANIDNELIPVFNFLSRDLNVPDHNYRKVINKCPRLLVSSAENQLRPALFYLKRLGFRDLAALAYQDCVLLVSNVENTLMPKLDYLISLGFSKPEAIEMVLRCPGLFTFSLDNNFKPKFEYFEKEMKRDMNELKDFPQYFAFSLEKRIKPRHLEAVECGAEIPLPLLLKTTDEEFAELLKQRNK